MTTVRATSRLVAHASWLRVGSPLGPLTAAVTSHGLSVLQFDDDGQTVDAAQPGGGLLDETRRQLDEYFTGRRKVFDIPVDLRSVTAFGRRVLAETIRIGFGETATYGQIATAIGRPHAARAVGRALNANPVAIIVGCHRVVGSSGSLTGYAGGLERKSRLLSLERGDPQRP